MSLLISRNARPELFSDSEKPLSDIINIVEMVYSELTDKPDGYNQQELFKTLKTAGISSYDINLALTILYQTKRILMIVG
jgi:hypothetical protein